MPAQVLLNIYDLNGKLITANSVLSAVGTGAFHAAVEVYGKEFSFGAAASIAKACGIYECEPRSNTQHVFSESIDMGQTLLTEGEVCHLLNLLAPAWSARSYDFLRRNCSHFSDSFCRRLGVGPIPARVMNLAGAGAAVQDGLQQVASSASDAAFGVHRATSKLVDEGKVARGASETEGYAFGDLTRGLIARTSDAFYDVLIAGKEARGACANSDYQFGDFSNGILTKLTSASSCEPPLSSWPVASCQACVCVAPRAMHEPPWPRAA